MTNAFSGTIAATWRRRHVGVTLIELLVTLTVMGIFAAIAIPSMQSFIVNSRMRTAGNDFMLAIQRARAESMAQNQCVVLCKSSAESDGFRLCDTTGNNWAVGWAVYRLPSCDASSRPATASDVDSDSEKTRFVFSQEQLNSNLNISVTGTAVTAIVFSPRGIRFSDPPPSSVGDGTLSFEVKDTSASSSQQNQYGRRVCINYSGQARVQALTASCS